MVSVAAAKVMALAFPEVEEKSHFEKPDFRVRKRIFAVLHADKNVMVVKLSAIDQSVFCTFDGSVIHPIPGSWGRQGWTMIHLKKVKKSMLQDALFTAWKTVAGTNLVKKYFPNS